MCTPAPRLGPIVLLMILSCCSAAASAAGAIAPQSERLLYAGFAYSGDHSNETALYPYTAALASELHFDTLLTQKLRQRPALEQRVSFEISDGKNDVSSIAFALVQEGVESQKVDGKYWGIVTLQANVLAFNKASNSVVASYPVRMRFSHVKDTEFTSTDFMELMRAAYTSDKPDENIFEQWLNRFEKIAIRRGAQKYLRVTEIRLSDEAQKTLLRAGKSSDAFKNQVANLLEASVGEASGVSLVPNSGGEAIGGKMLYRFADGSSFQLSLPEADFAMSFTVRDFVSTQVEMPAYFQDIFRVKGTIAIKQPDANRTIIDENVFDTLIVTRPKKADVQINAWDQYFKVLQSLLRGIGTEMSTVDDSWLKSSAARELAAKPAFAASKQLLTGLR